MTFNLNAHTFPSNAYFSKIQTRSPQNDFADCVSAFQNKRDGKSRPFIYVCHNFFKLKLFLLPD